MRELLSPVAHVSPDLAAVDAVEVRASTMRVSMGWVGGGMESL